MLHFSLRALSIAMALFVANAGILVVQLLAGRRLSPYVGASLETWTAVIGVSLAAIGTGSFLGGKLAGRSYWRIGQMLVLGAAAFIGTLPFLGQNEGFPSLPFSLRVVCLALVTTFPATFFWSLLTPCAVRLLTSDPRRVGSSAGVVFALTTLGALAGDLGTLFVLVPQFDLDQITYGTAVMATLAALPLFFFASEKESLLEGTVEFDPLIAPEEIAEHSTLGRAAREAAAEPILPPADPLSLLPAGRIVFLTGFALTALEIVGFRLLGQRFGVSLWSVGSLVGVILFGSALGNLLGGRMGDRAARRADPERGEKFLGFCLVAAAAALSMIIVFYAAATNVNFLSHHQLPVRLLGWSVFLFFVPSLLLGMISPIVIRLMKPSREMAARRAGTIYALSTLGAVFGIFVTGYGLIPILGMFRTLFLISFFPMIAFLVGTSLRKRPLFLYPLGMVAGAAFAGFLIIPTNLFTKETIYTTIRVISEESGNRKRLQLDSLYHSFVDLDDPSFIGYPHEWVQLDFFQSQAKQKSPNVLVIGGGGYTFPRAARQLSQDAVLDVVEIDAGVTEVAKAHLGLKDEWKITSIHRDGRQHLIESEHQGNRDLILLDAVNDRTVPSHLLTREFNELVAKSLKPDGVYLLTVIDVPAHGRLWKSARRTLQETFPHVHVLTTNKRLDGDKREVLVLYASHQPIELFLTRINPRGIPIPDEQIERWLGGWEYPVLTDRYAPTDSFMAEIFRQETGDSK